MECITGRKLPNGARYIGSMKKNNDTTHYYKDEEGNYYYDTDKGEANGVHKKEH